MEGYHSLFKRRQLLVSAVSLTALGTQFVTSLFMASSQQEKASWNDGETQALVDYLWEHRAECGDGGTFKDTVFNAIPARIAHLLSSGPVKTAKQCKTKYNGVSKISVVVSLIKLISFTAQNHLSNNHHI
jgi:hypothetical protein